MDPPKIPANPQPTSSEILHLEATPDGDSFYNYHFCHATFQYKNHVLLDGDETTAPVNRLDTLLVPLKNPTEASHTILNGSDPLSFPTSPGPPNTNQPDGDNSPYSSETYDFSKVVVKYLNDMIMETELELTPVNELITPTGKYIDVTDGVPVIGFDPPPFPTDTEPRSTDPSSSSAILGSSNVALGTTGDNTSHNGETTDFPYAVLNYIQDILLEEDLEDKPCVLQNSLALQAAEKSFYDILVEKDPFSSDRIVESPSENWAPCSSDSDGNCNSYNNSFSDDLVKSNWISDQQELESSKSILSSKQLHERTSLEEFNRLLKNADEHSINGQKEVVSQYTAGQSKGKKNRQHEDDDYFEEARSNKHSLVSTEELKQLEILDDAFLQKIENKEPIPCPNFDTRRNEACKKFQQEQKLLASNIRAKGLIGDAEKVDLSTLLNHCAEAAGRGDQEGATEILKRIRQHSSPYGDASQRLAHYFSNGLESRLFGNANMLQERLPGHLVTIGDILKAYLLYCSICPFRKFSNFWTNRMIAKEAENKTRIHIIDFGIGYGFQWPCFLGRLSTRPGGPPRIRITGIDFPQPGFRPAERVEDTGRRLKRLAEALNVPFEYKAIAHKWECIRYEDLNIDRDEMIAVTCMYRLKQLPDDTMVLDSPRDAVLKLIRKINPEIFVHGIVNGSFNASFFTTRFRAALFHFSAMFDIFEANTPREDQERLIFEREMIGKHARNVIACEGFDRVERPETYKQWQSRNCRIGFRQLSLDKDIMRRVRGIKTNYHQDFVVEEEGQWMLMGWKGKILQALSAWKPV